MYDITHAPVMPYAKHQNKQGYSYYLGLFSLPHILSLTFNCGIQSSLQLMFSLCYLCNGAQTLGKEFESINISFTIHLSSARGTMFLLCHVPSTMNQLNLLKNEVVCTCGIN